MQTIIAAFDDRSTAQQAIDRLLDAGFDADHVHLQHGYDADAATTAGSPDAHQGFFGAIENFFSHLFSSDSAEHAGTYSEAVRRGSSVVVVDAKSEAEVDRARTLLSQFGTVDIDQRAAKWKSDGWSGYDASAAPLTGSQLAAERDTLGADAVLPVVQEELVVGKRTVDGGALRVVKRLTETPVSQLVTLRQERATIDRRPVDRLATEADFSNFKEGTVEVRESAEEAVVGKTARVVEEVRVGKEISERSETVSDTVRRTDVDVERVPGSGTLGSETRSDTAFDTAAGSTTRAGAGAEIGSGTGSLASRTSKATTLSDER